MIQLLLKFTMTLALTASLLHVSGYAAAQVCDITVPSGDTDALISAVGAAVGTIEDETICLTASTYVFAANQNLPTITNETILLGNDAVLNASTAPANSAYEYLIDTAAGSILRVEDLTVIGRQVRAAGTLTLSGVTLQASTLETKATTTITDSVFQNGKPFVNWGITSIVATDFIGNIGIKSGAIENNATLNISGSRFINNKATSTSDGVSGAIYSFGPLTIVDSLFQGNQSYYAGSAIYAYRNVTITGSVFTENLITNPAATSTVTTIAMNSIGVLNVSQSCFVNNSSTKGRSVGSLGNDASGIAENNWWGVKTGPGSGSVIPVDQSGFDATPFLTVPPDNCPVAPVLPMDQSVRTPADTPLGITLDVWGGRPPYAFGPVSTPVNGTLTGTEPDLVYSPRPGFAGVDQFTFEATDADGQSVMATVNVAIGHVPFPVSITVDSTAQEVPFTANNNCTLGEAIEAASTNMPVDACPGGSTFGLDVIDLLPGTYILTQGYFTKDNAATALPRVVGKTQINGNAATITRGGSQNLRFLYVDAFGSLSIENVVFTNGKLADTADSTTNLQHGGAIFSNGQLSVAHVTFSGNFARTGGAIANPTTNPVLVNFATFTANSAGLVGGALQGMATINDSLFEDNFITATTLGGGGALNGSVEVRRSTFRGNRARYGSAISAHRLTVADSLFESNVSLDAGSAIFINHLSQPVAITGSVFRNNASNTSATASIHINNPSGTAPTTTATLTGSCFYGNTPGAVRISRAYLIDAQGNWWGHATGPVILPDTRPGQSINISTAGIFTPYLTTPPAGCEAYPPLIANQVITALYRRETAVTLTANHGVPPLTLAILQAPSKGTLTGTVPNLIYRSHEGVRGSDTFTFSATNSTGESATGTVLIDITSDIDAIGRSVTASHLAASPVILAATGGYPPYSFTVTVPPQHGSLSGTAPDLSYMPAIPYSGLDQFTFTVTDAGGFTDTGIVTIDISHPLSAADQTVFSPSDTAVAFTLAASSPYPPLVFSDIVLPAFGTLNGVAPDLTYTPNPSYSGLDTMSFSVTDAYGFTGSATVTFDVAPALIARDYYFYARPATPIYVYLRPLGGREPIEFTVSTPQNGQFLGSPPFMRYLPDDDFFGVEHLTYTVTDANGTQAVGALHVSTNPALDALDQDVYTPYGTPLLMAMQSRGGYPPHRFTVTNMPQHGTLVEIASYIVYLPSAGYSGSDRVSFTVTDAEGFTSTGSIDITVGASLTLADKTLDTAYETPLDIMFAAAGGTPPYTYEVITSPMHGVLSGTMPDLTYTPMSGYSGPDTLTVRVTDRFRRTADSTITISIPAPLTVAAGDTAGLIAAILAANSSSQHDAILLGGGEYTFDADYLDTSSALPRIDSPLTLRGNGAALHRSGLQKFRFMTINQGVHVHLEGLTFVNGDIGTGAGAAILNDGALTIIDSTFEQNSGVNSGGYTASVIYNGHFLTVTNSRFRDNTAPHGAISSGAHDQVTVTGTSFTGNTGGITFSNSYDPYGGYIEPQQVIRDSCFTGNGVAIFRQPALSSYPAAILDVADNWWGAYDGPRDTGEIKGHGDTVNFDLRQDFLITPPAGCLSLPPTVIDQALFAVTERSRAFILEPEGGARPYGYTIDSLPTYGTLTGVAPDLVYTSSAGYTGSDSFTYTAFNGAGGGSASATVTLTVQPPLASGMAVTTERNIEIAVPLTSDDGQPPFVFTELTQPAHGYVGRTDTHFYYFPDLDYVGTDSFSYRITDGLGDSIVETVDIIVTPRTPATITVDTMASEVPFVNNGNCTIGEALRAAIINQAVDHCPAGSAIAVDIVDVPAGVYQHPTEAWSLHVADNTILRGAAIDKTVLTSAPGIKRGILDASGISTLQELTVRGGVADCCNRWTGGALQVNGNTTVRLVRFEDNKADSDGGAIYNNGTLYVVRSAFTGNAAPEGGAIYSYTTNSLTVLNSAFADNEVVYRGNAFAAFGPTKVHLSCILEGYAVNYTGHDLRYNWWQSSNNVPPDLTERPAICDTVQTLQPPEFRIDVADGDVAGLIAAIEQINLVGKGRIYLPRDAVFVLTEPYVIDPVYGAIALPPITGVVSFGVNNSATIRRTGKVPFRLFYVDGGELNIGRLKIEGMQYETAAVAYVANGQLRMGADRFDGNVSSAGGPVIVLENSTISSSSHVFVNNSGGVHIGAGSTGLLRYGCYVMNAGAGITNDASNPAFDAIGNWWDAVDGPSGSGSGHGDAVGPNVDVSSFKTVRPAECPVGLVYAPDQQLEMLTRDIKVSLMLAATGGDGIYTFAAGMPSHGMLSGTGTALTYTPDPGFTGDDSFPFIVTDSEGRSDTGVVTITVRLAEIAVDSTAQEVPFIVNGNCTLSEAIHAANTDTAVDACPAGNGRDAIVLQPGATYLLTAAASVTTVRQATGLTPIVSAIYIAGNGATIARDPSAPAFRLMLVEATGDLTIENLTLTGGKGSAEVPNNGGGGLYLLGRLEATNITVTGNVARYGGGLALFGTWTLRSSSIADNTSLDTGGNLYACPSGPSALIDTEIVRGTAVSGGGGLYHRCGTLHVNGGRLSGNTSPIKGAAIYAHYLSSPQLVMTGVVVENNPGVEGAIYNDRGRITITQSCILEAAPTTGIISPVQSPAAVNAAGNWWGSSTGPVYGTTVSGYVTATPHLLEPILGCAVHPPSAIDLTLHTAYEVPVDVTLAGVDGNPPYNLAVETDPIKGTLTGIAPELTYLPPVAFAGTDTFTYTVTDSLGRADTATIVIHVAADLSAEPAFFETAHNTPVHVSVVPVGGRAPFIWSLVGQPEFGTIMEDTGFIYTPLADFAGIDRASLRVTDSNGDTFDADFRIAVGDRLQAADQQFELKSGGGVTFRLWATGGIPGFNTMPTPTPGSYGDPDGYAYSDDYTFSPLSEPLHGTLHTFDGLNWTYIADTGFVGSEALSFTVTDRRGISDEGVITIVVSQASFTSTLSPTESETPSQTPTIILTDTHTETYTPSLTPTAMPTYTSTSTYTPSLTPTVIPTHTYTSTDTPSLTPSFTPSLTPEGALLPPSQPNLYSPPAGGQIIGASPSFTWAANPGWEHIDWYKLVIKQADGTTIVAVKVQAAECSSGTCSYDLSSVRRSLPNGSYTWFVKASNSRGKITSVKNALTIVFPSPSSPFEPANGLTTNDRQPTFVWSFVETATEYRLLVKLGSKKVLKQWLSASAANCNDVLCSVDLNALNVKLPRGELRWRVDTRNTPLGPSVTRSGWQRLTITR